MQRWPLILIALMMIAAVASAASSTAPTSIRRPLQSKPVEKDGVAVSIVAKQTSFPADAQPGFIVRFTNVGTDARNLYDVSAYWNWSIQLTKSDALVPEPGPWQVRMNSIPMRAQIDHRRIQAGESTDVSVNLNDPPFTFHYSYEGVVKHLIAPTRYLDPGHYQLSATVALADFPMGKNPAFWLGPVTTNPVELTITESQQRSDTTEDRAAYDAAIGRVTDKLQPGGLWTNGHFLEINLPADARAEDVIDTAVNQTSLGSKDYRLLRVQPFGRDQSPPTASGLAALLRVGKSYKVVILFPIGKSGWWSRFYDTELVFPATRPAAASDHSTPTR